jgi:hypothetical protein
LTRPLDIGDKPIAAAVGAQIADRAPALIGTSSVEFVAEAAADVGFVIGGDKRKYVVQGRLLLTACERTWPVASGCQVLASRLVPATRYGTLPAGGGMPAGESPADARTHAAQHQVVIDALSGWGR